MTSVGNDGFRILDGPISASRNPEILEMAQVDIIDGAEAMRILGYGFQGHEIPQDETATKLSERFARPAILQQLTDAAQKFVAACSKDWETDSLADFTQLHQWCDAGVKTVDTNTAMGVARAGFDLLASTIHKLTHSVVGRSF